MANRLTSNPIYFDQFNGDATLSINGRPLRIRKIRWKSVADGDKFQLEDSLGNVLFEDIQTSAGDWRDIDFGIKGHTFNDGVNIDVSDCTGMTAIDGTDAVYIYLVN